MSGVTGGSSGVPTPPVNISIGTAKAGEKPPTQSQAAPTPAPTAAPGAAAARQAEVAMQAAHIQAQVTAAAPKTMLGTAELTGANAKFYNTYLANLKAKNIDPPPTNSAQAKEALKKDGVDFVIWHSATQQKNPWVLIKGETTARLLNVNEDLKGQVQDANYASNTAKMNGVALRLSDLFQVNPQIGKGGKVVDTYEQALKAVTDDFTFSHKGEGYPFAIFPSRSFPNTVNVVVHKKSPEDPVPLVHRVAIDGNMETNIRNLLE